MNREGNRDRIARLRAGRAVVEAAGALDDLLLGDGDDVGGDVVELKGGVSNAGAIAKDNEVHVRPSS